MSLIDRLVYAAIAGFFGLLLGVLGWFLYGLGYSRPWSGPGLDPLLRHWLVGAGGAMAALGFVLGPRAADALGDVLAAVLSFELAEGHRAVTALFLLVFIALVMAALWASAPAPR